MTVERSANSASTAARPASMGRPLDVVELLAAAFVDQLEMAVDAEADNRRGEHAVVEPHLLDEAHRGGRHAGRRRELRNDGAAGGSRPTSNHASK